MQYEGVLFDLGGTLFEHLPTKITNDNLLHVLARSGLATANASHAQAVYRQCRGASEHVRLKAPFFLHKEVVVEAFADTLNALGLEQDPDAVEAFYQRQRESVVKTLTLRAETQPLLTTLRERGCYLSIVSNIDNDYFEPLLERSGLAALVDHCISSESARSCKPDSEIFSKAIAASELTADRLLYVGDSPQHDVAGAHMVGLAAAWLHSGALAGADQALGRAAEHRIETLLDLLDIVTGS